MLGYMAYENISLKKKDEDFGTSASDIDDYQLLRHGQWSILTAFGMMLTFWTVVQAEITTLTTSLKRISRPYPKAASGIFYLPAFIITIIDLATTHMCVPHAKTFIWFLWLWVTSAFDCQMSMEKHEAPNVVVSAWQKKKRTGWKAWKEMPNKSFFYCFTVLTKKETKPLPPQLYYSSLPQASLSCSPLTHKKVLP